ncbi:MAG TPA: hypothetical protein VE078_14280 [Thermoanaerobaculia bacterium]|nr:hypothetical protein [Thermoanaerobaculia bacterium]
MRTNILAALVLALGATAAVGQPAHVHGEEPKKAEAAPEPLVDDLGSHHRTVTTSSPEAQRYFDQGLRLLFSFNLEEAQQSFEEAARRDPECAMCFWGVGMSLGPHINMPGMPDRTRAGHQAAQKALALAKTSTPTEKALIEALAKRFSDPPPANPAGQSALDTAYAEAMRGVLKRFPEDVDITVLTAEALMDLHPWDLWTLQGEAQPWTAEIVTLLEQALAKDPNHPGANHYYIHAVEASPHPEKALAAAGRVGALVPGAAHMVHMPSHIYARVGRWSDASEANRQAIAVDRDYLGTASGLGFYFMYAAHNFQFLWFTSLMSGHGAVALENARAVVSQAPVEMLQQMPGYDFLLGYPIWTLVPMGRWNEVLAEPAPPLGFPYVRAVWHGARAIALMALGREEEAVTERASMVRVATEVPAEAMQGLNSARTLLGIAVGIVDGRLAAARGMTDEAVERLREAVRLEDTLRYNEPPDWYYPALHDLGAVLAAAGQPVEAQTVWEEDLRRNPENGWALAGLAEALRGQQKEKDAAAVRERFEKAWKGADIPVRP